MVCHVALLCYYVALHYLIRYVATVRRRAEPQARKRGRGVLLYYEGTFFMMELGSFCVNLVFFKLGLSSLHDNKHKPKIHA